MGFKCLCCVLWLIKAFQLFNIFLSASTCRTLRPPSTAWPTIGGSICSKLIPNFSVLANIGLNLARKAFLIGQINKQVDHGGGGSGSHGRRGSRGGTRAARSAGLFCCDAAGVSSDLVLMNC